MRSVQSAAKAVVFAWLSCCSCCTAQLSCAWRRAALGHTVVLLPKAKTITCWLRSAHDKFLLFVFPRLSKGSVCVISLFWTLCTLVSSAGRSYFSYSFPLAAEEAGGDRKWRRFSLPLPLHKVSCLIKGSSMETDDFSCIKTS